MRLVPIAALALALAPAACGGPASTGDGARPRPRPPADIAPAPAAAPIPLAGEYRIAGVDDREIDLPHAITASITAARIHVTADCLTFGWAYTRDGDAIATERVAVESCARGLAPAEEAVVAAIDAARRIAPSPANGADLAGGGRRLTLFSQ